MITTFTASGSARITVFALPARTLYGSLRLSWLSYLGDTERQRAASIPTPAGTIKYLSTQALMRAIAAARLDISPRKAHLIEVNRSCTLCTSTKPHGKPRIAGVNFNMSQVNSLSVGGFCPSPALVFGVDLESLDTRLFPGFARVTLNSTERAVYDTAEPAIRTALGLALWTAKEAVLKATGYGLSIPPTRVRVQLPDTFASSITRAFATHRAGNEMSHSPVAEARATLTFPATGSDSPHNSAAKEQEFYISWRALTLHPDAKNNPHSGSEPEQFLLATATLGEPHNASVYPVSTPTDIRHALSNHPYRDLQLLEHKRTTIAPR